MTKKLKIHDAVVAVFTHQDSFFAIHRQPYLAAFPGYHSFPGGKIEKDESEEPYHTPLLKKYPPRWMRALCREIQEELHFDLEQAIQTNQVLSISEMGVAMTPSFVPIRFNARFYQIELQFQIPFDADSNEAQAASWFTYQDFMTQFDQGSLLTAEPTFNVVKNLQAKRPIHPDTPLHVIYDATTEVPVLESVKHIYQLLVESNTLPPAQHTNALVIGDHLAKRYVIDPAPKSLAELEKLKKTLIPLQVTNIFLTHHHIDHHEHANVLAKDLSLSIKLSQDSYDRICQQQGADYFDGISVEIAQAGEVLTQWLGKDVLIHAIPGHDQGQLGLAPTSLEWFVVGDLIQGIGTVVIHEPEGNMKQYFETLTYVINLDPKIIIPSHGLAMQGTYRLKKTLEHRQMRERQVLQYYRDGKTKEDMLHLIYQDVDPRLYPYALYNIESHLKKLKDDALI